MLYFYYVILIFIVNMLGLLFCKYGKIKVVNFTIPRWNHGYKTMIGTFIQHRMKENLFLLKDLLENKIYKYMAAKSKKILYKLQICILINYKNKYQYNIKYNIKIQSQNTIINTNGKLKWNLLTLSWVYVLKCIVETFFEKELQKTNQTRV